MIHKVYIFGICVKRAFQNSIIHNRSNEIISDRTRTKSCQTLLEVKSRATLLVNFSKTAEQKQTPSTQFVELLEIRIISKNEPNRYILRGVIAIIRYGTK